jgi:ATP-binding cassette subfamily B protein
MTSRDLEACGWRDSQIGDAMSALARKAGLAARNAALVNPKDAGGDAGAWIEWAAAQLGCEAEAMTTTFRELEAELTSAHPALLRISDSHFLAIFDGNGGTLRVLTPELRLRSIAVHDLARAIREPAERGLRSDLEQFVKEAEIASPCQAKTVKFLLEEQLGDKRFDQFWTLRVAPGATCGRWIGQVGALKNGGRLIAAHTGQYLLWLASWAILGRLSFEGRLDRGWLVAWALLLLTLIPFRVLTTWLQGLLATGIGGLLKRRLLYGAMRLSPEELRHCGIGSFLGQVLEAEAVETLALSGGIAGLLALIELAISMLVLGRFATLLLAWCGLTAALAWRFMKRYRTWTDTRMPITQDLVESMVGHRTRLAQQRREEWHESEDQALEGYLASSRSVDSAGGLLMAGIPRGWLFVGLASIAPLVVAGQSSRTSIAVVLGGILLAFLAFKRLTGSFAEIAAAWVAWKRISSLFAAAARPEMLGEAPDGRRSEEPVQKVIEADRLTYRYRKEGNPALQACSVVIRRGERILLEGPSGGGKTTFASLLSGLREPDSGLLLINGLDRHTLGAGRWRERVAAAPQFHENHILTETLAFNLLMGRRWPPTGADMDKAESMCRQLGLGDLLDRLPSGLQQMVGEGGWQLSHGERSRVYIARALLQGADMVVLDESFAALDPENLRVALECTLEHAETLLVIAHP